MRKGLLGLLAAVTALSGCSVVAAADTVPVAGPPSSSACRAAELTASLRPADGSLVLFNDATRSCTLTGRVQLSYVVTEDGQPAGEAFTGGDTDVTVKPGGTATAGVVPFHTDGCQPVDVAGIRVTLPGQGTPLFIAGPGRVCSTGAGTVGSLTAAPPRTEQCHTAKLSVTVEKDKLVFHNKLRQPCTMIGAPGVSWVTAAGKQVGDPFDQTHDGVRKVVVPAGGTARAAIDTCRPNGATALRVYPPNETEPLRVGFAGRKCTAGNRGEVTAVTR